MPLYEHALCEVCNEKRGVNLETLAETILLSVEIAREGREGRKVGTLFVVSDHENVLRLSRPLILDPLYGHPPEAKRLSDHNTRETIKELAQMDGAFVISDDGVAVSACRYIQAVADDVELPLGLGARHMAGAAITKVTDAVAVVVSEASIVRVCDDGEIVGEIIPEMWLMSKYGHHLNGPYSERKSEDLTIFSRTD